MRRAGPLTNRARERNEPLKPRLVALIQRRYDAIVAAGHAFHAAPPPLPSKPGTLGKPRGRPRRRTGHHLALSTRRDDGLRFLTDPRGPSTHPLAAQAARMMKVRQKISGGFRSEQGARDFAVIRSLIATAKKQGWNIIHTLTQSPALLIAQLRIA